MRIFGSWTEIKNLVFRKGSRQVTVEPSTQTVGDGTINVPDMAGTTQDVVLNTQAQALTNKTVVVASNTVTTAASGNLVATELNAALSELQSDIDTRATSSSLTTHTGASSGVHGVTGAVVGTTDTQTLTNKTLTTPVLDVIDSAFNIQNNGGPTKKAQFDCSLIPSATTRIFTFPNTAGSVITTDLAVQTLVNKDIDGGTASNTNRITLPKAAKATLDALTRKEGTLVYATDLVKPYYDDGSTLREIGSGSGSGGINYITNSSFEDGNSTGWATYQDAAATTPVNGTAGTANSTFAASATGPLRGTYSGLFTKNSGASRQGEGFSYDFTIASADVSRPLLVTWEGSASANYTGSSGSEYLAVYLYDVTNSTLISPASTTVAPGTSKGSTFFVATTSTSYRLIFHVAGTGTSAWTYKIDSVSVGPQSIAMGPALTDWQLDSGFTPNATAFGTIANQAFYRRRVGDSMQVVGEFKAGTAGAATASVTLPTGYTIDTSKLTAQANTQGIGTFTRVQSASTATTTNTGKLFYDGSTNNTIYFSVNQASFAFTKENGGSLFGNNEVFSLEFTVPISQWSSSNFQTADRAVEEYAYNSDTANADDSTSFGYGTAGVQFGSYTGVKTKKVQFQSPIQATDNLFLEVSEDSGVTWQPANLYTNGITPYTLQNGIGYGFTISRIETTNLIQVQFGDYRYASNTTFGGVGATWSGIAAGARRWRVRKVSGGASVGYPVGSQNIVGRVDGVAPATGYVGQYKSQQSTGDYSPTTSYATVTGCSISLEAGVWLIHADATCQLDASNSMNIAIYNGTTQIADSLRSLVLNSTSSMALHTSTIVNITTTTTYSLHARASANGISQIFQQNSTAGLSGNDCATVIYAVRIA